MRGPATSALLLAALMTTSCTAETPPSPVETAPSTATTSATATVVATDLQAPWSIVFHGRTPLISERDSGRILELDDDGNAHEIAALDDVAAGGEGGLLGLAVRDDHLYAYLTSSDGGRDRDNLGRDNRIVRFRLVGAPGGLALTERETVLDGIPAAGIHNGGRIAFGPDGMLYATTGDAGNRALSQDRSSLGGKILRMTPDGGVPADNPFPGSLVYSYGHRNAQGLAWDDDGRMFAAEFGQNTWDELNVIEAGGNYGWPIVEGIAGRAGFIDPVQQWAPADASPSGIAVDGRSLLIANLRGERLRRVALDNLGTSTEQWTGRYGRLREVTVTPTGAVWVLTNNTDGRGSPGADDDRVLVATTEPPR